MLQPVAKEGLAAQVNSLGTVYSTELTSELLTKCLNDTIAKLPSPNYNTICTGEVGAELFWDVVWNGRWIKLYGVKYIEPFDNGFIYEAIVFDDFPKDKDSYSIHVAGIGIEEETFLHIISDTCIRFTLSKQYSETFDFILNWD